MRYSTVETKRMKHACRFETCWLLQHEAASLCDVIAVNGGLDPREQSLQRPGLTLAVYTYGKHCAFNDMTNIPPN